MTEVMSSNADLMKHSQYLEQEQLLMKVRGFVPATSIPIAIPSQGHL